jgi:hypothetical protein
MRLLIATLLYLGLANPIFAQAEEASLFSIRSGETLPLKSITWTSAGACTSMLVSVDSIDVLEEVPGITLTFAPKPIHVAWKGCPGGETVDGGHVMASADKVTHKTEGDLTYRVQIQSKTGPAQMTYRAHVIIFPAASQKSTNAARTP